MIIAYQKLWHIKRKTDEEIESLKQLIINAIGENSGIYTPCGNKITYKKSKDSVSEYVDWEGLSMNMAKRYSIDDVQYNELVTKHRVSLKKTGSRTFRVPTNAWKI